MHIVNNHWCVWRYDFNASKSGVLVYGKNKRENKRNSLIRNFKLGREKVKEKLNYDHLGIKASIFEDGTSGIDERLAKGRRALNTTSGLGIRNNGLTIYACCVIFCCIVMPIATFGAELWILDDKCIKLLESFQMYVGRKVQRLYIKSPNVCAYFPLEWMRIERFIEIKKLLFVQTIMSLPDGDSTKTVFIQRAKRYSNNVDECSLNVNRSAVYDLLNTAVTFGYVNDIKNMIYQNHIWNRTHWREKLWRRAWELEDMYGCLKSRCYKSLNMLVNICTNTSYVIWWQVADKYHWLIKDCEIMVKLLCHSSLLKLDDVRLKGLPLAAKFCSSCDYSATDDAEHMIMQCPSLQPIRTEMFVEMNQIQDYPGNVLFEPGENTFLILMGKPYLNLNAATMESIWKIAARHISNMYRWKLRQGIG